MTHQIHALLINVEVGDGLFDETSDVGDIIHTGPEDVAAGIRRVPVLIAEGVHLAIGHHKHDPLSLCHFAQTKVGVLPDRCSRVAVE